ncbi:hypothetical protein SPRG_19131 [Saprolegnia parasitica CBS 223.65]|uniref:Kinesin motor domain-containing protein n=1 Tax=Saprolegnia parasitica (strain CBS 223.65) TaxID=695850 RepID=A0A067D5N8_SAPPC|nr:hypothetical protein SPRG_19131 [Saprolegnia parasitica CBS 223.65]KDO34317.1 hypothetical protein SPRG_19131 [Saprolegnia parasitica CBS 223.65]|eukprot:XP_012195322.1 hypothetical protein SPRG_19131 [Saprolegnia parasitica CBS 223.65]
MEVQRDLGRRQATTVKIGDERMDFDQCYDETATQHELFRREMAAAIPLAFDGKSTTLIAYGPGKSGKTFTIDGSTTSPGLVPRTMQRLLQFQQASAPLHTIQLSVLEIHRNKVFDLLDTKSDRTDLPIRQSATGNVVVPGLATLPITTFAQFRRLYEHASRPQSRESHKIVTFSVQTTGVDGEPTAGTIHLVDLARVDESRRRSLQPRSSDSSSNAMTFFVLGKVLGAINEGKSLVPFRDSKLTRLLHDGLCRDMHAATLLCTVSTANVDDAFHALQYAAKVRHPTTLRSPMQMTPETSALPPPDPTPTLSSLEERLEAWPDEATTGAKLCIRRATQKPKLESPPKTPVALKAAPTGTPKTPSRIPMRRESIAPLTTVRKPLSNLTNLPPTITPTKDTFQTPVKVSKPSTADMIRKLLHLAMTFEKRDRLAAALAVYNCTNCLLPATSTKLKARIDRLQTELTSARHMLVDLKAPIETTLQAILTNDVLETLNTGSKPALLELQGIGGKRAAEILRARRLGPFTSVHDLHRAGMSTKHIQSFLECNVASPARL